MHEWVRSTQLDNVMEDSFIKVTITTNDMNRVLSINPIIQNNCARWWTWKENSTQETCEETLHIILLLNYFKTTKGGWLAFSAEENEKSNSSKRPLLNTTLIQQLSFQFSYFIKDKDTTVYTQIKPHSSTQHSKQHHSLTFKPPLSPNQYLSHPLQFNSHNIKQMAHPWVGSKVIALGSSRWSLIRIFLDEPLSLLTSIRSVPVSVQYKLRATQSTATPSGCLISLVTTTCTSKERNTRQQ